MPRFSKILILAFAIISQINGREAIEALVVEIDVGNQQFIIEPVLPINLAPLNAQGMIVVNVGEGDSQLSYQGKKIRGRLMQSDGKLRLEKIWPILPDQERIMASINQQLQVDTAVRQKRQFRKTGDYGINFAMFDQNGSFVQWNQFKGVWIVMNFIFTRCRIPTMCPAQTDNMAKMQTLLASHSLTSDVNLISVTFDPKYDTPGILHQYAAERGITSDNFKFLTGDYQTMLNLLKQYGVIAFESKNIIDHTVTTLLFNKTGKIVKRIDGTRWDPHEFLDIILESQTGIDTR